MCVGHWLSYWLLRDVVVSQRLGLDICRGKQYPEPCTVESLPSSCPAFSALFAVVDDEGCYSYTSGTRWAQRRDRRRSLRVVASNFWKAILFSRQQQQLRLPQTHLFHHWRCRQEMATTFRGQFTASKTARAVVHSTKGSLVASFARDTPPCSSNVELLMNPSYCWRLSACLTRLGVRC